MAVRGIVEVLKKAGKDNKRAFSNKGFQILLAILTKLVAYSILKKRSEAAVKCTMIKLFFHKRPNKKNILFICVKYS